jgi:hypothetical protein
VKLGVPTAEIQRLMLRGELDSLTTISRDDIEREIAYIRTRIGEARPDLWDAFYRYFRATWMADYDFNTWNIRELIESNVDIQKE